MANICHISPQVVDEISQNFNTLPICSNNETFDSLVDENTYITEVAILDNQNNTVAVGKPTYPLKKANSRYLAFQLIIDF